MIESPVLTSVKAKFEGLDVYDVEPAELPDVLGERPVIVFGKWRAPASGEVKGRIRSFYVLPFPGRYIWGATAGMLVNLAEVLGGR